MIKKEGSKQKVTLSLDSETYKKFQEFCEERGVMLSKRVELFMKGEMDWHKRKIDRRQVEWQIVKRG